MAAGVPDFAGDFCGDSCCLHTIQVLLRLPSICHVLPVVFLLTEVQ